MQHKHFPTPFLLMFFLLFSSPVKSFGRVRMGREKRHRLDSGSARAV